MKTITVRSAFLVLISLSISSCSLSVDEEELTRQLEETYSACKNEGIDDIASLENSLNNGGNNLSKACRVALGSIDFAGIVSAFDVSLDFELPSPGQEINPLLSESSSWQKVSEWSAGEFTQYISTGLDFAGQSDISLQGVGSDGSITDITNFTVNAVVDGDVVISYTTDYSGSMLQSDILAVDGYFQDFHSTLPSTTPASVAIFSDELTAKTTGFVSDATTVNAALTFDSNYTRASTALYDAWGDALTKLEAENAKFALNIITTDGFENSSIVYASRSALRQKILDSKAFNIVIASSWAETSVLQGLVADKGIVIYKYQIDEAQRIIANIKTMMANMKEVVVSDGVSGFDSLNLIYNNETKTSIVLPQ